MSDLTTRLRALSGDGSTGYGMPICADAADEIERLEAENAALRIDNLLLAKENAELRGAALSDAMQSTLLENTRKHLAAREELEAENAELKAQLAERDAALAAMTRERDELRERLGLEEIEWAKQKIRADIAEAALAQAEKDAERYRWLESVAQPAYIAPASDLDTRMEWKLPMLISMTCINSEVSFAEAIDAARKTK